jgi:uridine kinase
MASTDPVGVVSFDALVDRVKAGPPGLGATRLICVDGPAGSGKTTVAERLATTATRRGLTVLLLHMDDLYDGWDGAVRGFGLLRDHVLARIAAGQEGRYRRYDWHAGTYAERHTVPAGLDVLIVEGVTSADRGVEPWPSLRIWVETSNAFRLDRGIERDGEALRDRWLDWMRWERDHFAEQGTRSRADLVVDGAPTVPHDPETEIVVTRGATWPTAPHTTEVNR